MSEFFAIINEDTSKYMSRKCCFRTLVSSKKKKCEFIRLNKAIILKKGLLLTYFRVNVCKNIKDKG